ncbi:hypothetical protein ACFL5N_01815, partial [bacterium]
MKAFNVCRKVITIIALSCFLVSAASSYTYAATIPTVEARLILPANLGKIVDKYQASDPEKIIIIQDIHCDPNVQENIYKIIQKLKQTYKNDLKVIGVEGTPQVEIKPEIFSKIPDKEIREKVTKKYVNTGYVTGEEWYKIMNPGKITLEGIEDEKVYNENFMALYKSLNYREELEALFEKLEKGYERAKKYLYIGDIKELEEKAREYENPKIGLGEYLRFLDKKIVEHGINLEREYPNVKMYMKKSEIEEKLNTGLIQNDVKYLMRRLSEILTEKELKILRERREESANEYYKELKRIIEKRRIEVTGIYKHLLEYFKYMEIDEKIDEMKLMEEVEELEYEIKSKEIGDREDIRGLLMNEESVEIYKRYIWNKASTRDVEECERDLRKLEELEKYSGKILRKDFIAEQKEELERALANMGVFYRAAEKRNEIMGQNILGTETRGSKVKCMIVGGYHTEGLKNYLKSRGKSYEVIMPLVE